MIASLVCIRGNTRPTDADLNEISLKELVELSWDCTQQYLHDGSGMPDDEAAAWEQLLRDMARGFYDKP